MQGMAMFFISTAFSKPNLHTYVLNFFLARPAQDVFLLPLVPWLEQGGSLLLVILLYDLGYGRTINVFYFINKYSTWE